MVLTFLEKFNADQLLQPIPSFNDKNFLYFLVHVNQVYLHWIGKLALDAHKDYIIESDVTTLNQVKVLFKATDELMESFFKKYDDQWDLKINKFFSNRQINTTPLELFTHVITHEFHHKGQMMTMARLMGHIPPDADVIRFP